MIYCNKINLILSSLFLLFISIIVLFFLDTSFLYCAVYSNRFDLEQQIKQLNQLSDAHSQCLIQLQQQLSENQKDLDQLRGCIQNIQHNIAKMTNKQEELCRKLKLTAIQNNNMQLPCDNTQQSLVMGHIPIGITSDKKANIVDLGETDYKIAVGLVLEKKQYVQAIKSFQDFIKKYPQSNYQSNAHYWLGQLYYNQGNKHDASYHFALVVKNYPNSSKSSDALLKIGIIMQETNQIDKAKTVYRQVKKLYPDSDASKQAQKYLLHLS